MVNDMNEISDIIAKAAEKFGIPFSLLYEQAWQESNLNPKAISPCGAMGIMQLMEGTARQMGLSSKECFEPEKNIMAGAKYLKGRYTILRQSYPKMEDDECWKFALASYNGGLGYVLKAIGLYKGAEGGPLEWDRIKIYLSSPYCMVKGKKPDHTQIVNYVGLIWSKYEKGK